MIINNYHDSIIISPSSSHHYYHYSHQDNFLYHSYYHYHHNHTVVINQSVTSSTTILLFPHPIIFPYPIPTLALTKITSRAHHSSISPIISSLLPISSYIIRLYLVCTYFIGSRSLQSPTFPFSSPDLYGILEVQVVI